MPKYLKITSAELLALIETAETCDSIGGEVAYEADAAIKAYKAVLKRNGMAIVKPYAKAPKPDSMRE